MIHSFISNLSVDMEQINILQLLISVQLSSTMFTTAVRNYGAASFFNLFFLLIFFWFVASKGWWLRLRMFCRLLFFGLIC